MIRYIWVVNKFDWDKGYQYLVKVFSSQGSALKYIQKHQDALESYNLSKEILRD